MYLFYTGSLLVLSLACITTACTGIGNGESLEQDGGTAEARPNDSTDSKVQDSDTDDGLETTPDSDSDSAFDADSDTDSALHSDGGTDAYADPDETYDPTPDSNPSVADSGASSMHGDTVSSDTTPKPGPGMENLKSRYTQMFGACSTVLIRSDGRPMLLCTAWLGRDPTIRILDRNSSAPLARLQLPSGSLLGGVYAYLDNEDRLVMVDGDQNLIRIKAGFVNKPLISGWELSIDESVPLALAVTEHCGGSGCDAVVSISPDGDGAVWFATREGVVGIYHPGSGVIDHIVLGEDEAIHNSFSTTNDGRAAIATDHALYLLNKDDLGRPTIRWRKDYDRGSARKPGQLSYGTGATPTFFGPTNGSDFVTITDNADEQMSLLVFDADVDAPADGGNGGELVCQLGVFEKDASGTENSAIAFGNSIYVASTYGYPYPAVPEGAGPAVPESADFSGGMARVDVRQDRSGCDLVWQNDLRSSAVPKMSVADELIYTIERRSPSLIDIEGAFDTYHFTVIDSHSGEVLSQIQVGGTLAHDTLQMAGNVGTDGVYWQGTLGGILRISS